MMSAVITRKYDPPAIDRGEILRYMGCRRQTPEIEALIDSCLDEANGRLSCKVCYGVFDTDLFCDGKEAAPMGSLDLKKNLTGCSRSILFAATIGIDLDRLIFRYSRLSPARALCFQAIGAERIESLCNAFNEDIRIEYKEKGFLSRPRFSPGYGDFPLSSQKQFFDLLDCPRKIGLSLTESLLMSPSKSVTAIIGLYPDTSEAEENCQRKSPDFHGNDCKTCSKLDCSFRKE